MPGERSDLIKQNQRVVLGAHYLRPLSALSIPLLLLCCSPKPVEKFVPPYSSQDSATYLKWRTDQSFELQTKVRQVRHALKPMEQLFERLEQLVQTDFLAKLFKDPLEDFQKNETQLDTLVKGFRYFQELLSEESRKLIHTSRNDPSRSWTYLLNLKLPTTLSREIPCTSWNLKFSGSNADVASSRVSLKGEISACESPDFIIIEEKIEGEGKEKGEEKALHFHLEAFIQFLLNQVPLTAASPSCKMTFDGAKNMSTLSCPKTKIQFNRKALESSGSTQLSFVELSHYQVLVNDSDDFAGKLGLSIDLGKYKDIKLDLEKDFNSVLKVALSALSGPGSKNQVDDRDKNEESDKSGASAHE